MSSERSQYGFGRVYKRGNTWWVQYHYRGRRVRESSGSHRKTDAVKLLRKRLEEMSSGKFVANNAERVKFDDLVDLLKQDYELNGRRSLSTALCAVDHLRSAFGFDRAVDITSDRVHTYIYKRLSGGAKPATVAKEKSALRRMFKLAMRRGLLHRMPEFPEIEVDNARQEFIEESDFTALMLELPASLRPVFEFAYLTGWRVQSEVRVLKWDQVDFGAGTVQLRIRTTKNNEPRMFPFAALPPLGALLERQREYTEEWQRRTGKMIPYVFHRDGRPMKDFRHAWCTACKRAGVFGADCGTKVPHDLRRTAVRNLVRAGVPENTAMKLTGHKTREVFDRYDIVSGADLVDAVGKLAKFHGAKEDAQPADSKLGTIWAQSEESVRTA